MIAAALDAAVRAVCPISGVSLGSLADRATWAIRFMPEATAQQRAAAAAVLAAFDPSAVKEPQPRNLPAEIDALAARNAKLEAALTAKNLVTHEEIAAAPRTLDGEGIA